MDEGLKIKVVMDTTSGSGENSKRHLKKGNIIAKISKILSKKSNDKRPEPPETEILSGKLLTSDLVIQPPAFGFFSTELQIGNVMKKTNTRLIIVKVYGTKIQILFGRISQVEQIGREKDNESVKKLTLKKKTNAKNANRKECGQDINEEAIEHGHVCLPDYILPQTLQFSINCFGNLQIKAKIKGAIGPLI